MLNAEQGKSIGTDHTPRKMGGAKVIVLLTQTDCLLPVAPVLSWTKLACSSLRLRISRMALCRGINTLLVMSLLAAVCHASSSTGSIMGTIVDQGGTALAQATVELRNRDTGVVRTATVDRSGNYSFVLLPPGTYDVIVHMQGFRDGAYSGIQVDVDEVRRADLTLEVAPVTFKVQVTGEAPLRVETETSSVGQVVPRRLIANLPLNERNYLSYTLLVPGAHTPVAGSQSSTMGPGSVSVNGAREQANGFILDGIDNNGLYINRTSVLPSIDAIDEFKMQSSTYSAEYGRNGGAQVDLVLKRVSMKGICAAF